MEAGRVGNAVPPPPTPPLFEVDDLYNIVVGASALVVDLRPRTDYDASHVNTAIGLCFLSSQSVEGEGDSAVEAALFGPNAAGRWRSTSQQKRTVIAYASAEAADSLDARTRKALDSAHAGAWKLLRGGFSAFAAAFPFLCSPTKRSGAAAAVPNEGTPVVDAASATAVAAPPPPPPPLPLVRKWRPTPPAAAPSVVVFDDDDGSGSCSAASTAVHFPAMVEPGFLFLGGEDAARSATVLRSLGITHVVNMCAELAPTMPSSSSSLQVLHCPLDDSVSQEILASVRTVHAFVEQARACGGRVLLHCAMGISRSAAAAVGHLMLARRWPLARALAHVRACRPQARPNPGFLRQLVCLEEEGATA